MSRRTRLGILMPWLIVGLGLVAACLLALLGPFGQVHCATQPSPTNWAQQLPRPKPLFGHPGKVVLCSNTGGYPMLGAP